MSKIQFWKQFTTIQKFFSSSFELYSICQRYNFESNLQLIGLTLNLQICCIRYVKDTILKAIYNNSYTRNRFVQAVFDMSKIQFWKQFTTLYLKSLSISLLYSICQRYNFESNLQLTQPCVSPFTAVFDMSKIQFWKQFTTGSFSKSKFVGLYSICQRYNFESNLQLLDLRYCNYQSCIRYVKDTILKAIYNFFDTDYLASNAVFDMSKIQFWKQFTTTTAAFYPQAALYSICQRYNFESNLQLRTVVNGTTHCCIRYVKDTILKAIYNWRWNMCL